MASNWILVPAEPTPEMLAALGDMESVEMWFSNQAQADEWLAETYRTMLAARPEPERADDILTALDQAIAIAEYVESHAKGAMVERVKHFLSLPFAQELRARRAARRDWEAMADEMVAAAAALTLTSDGRGYFASGADINRFRDALARCRAMKGK